MELHMHIMYYNYTALYRTHSNKVVWWVSIREEGEELKSG